MIRKFCRIFCLVFLISDFQTSFSQHNVEKAKLSRLPVDSEPMVSLDDAGHHASIRLVENESTFGEGHICEGSLISSGVVLTAAHCLFDPITKVARHPAELYVVMGTLNRYEESEHTFASKVTHIRYPPTFDVHTRRDDIGLLFLSQEIPGNHEKVRPIEMNSDTVAVEILGAVTSWGKDEKGETSHHLLAVNVSTIDAFSCAKSFGRLITDGMLCATHQDFDGDICQMDVGAPLVHEGKQVGIVSWANSCTSKDYPGIYTDVAYHNEWIWRELSDKNNADSSIWGLLGFLAFSWYAFKDQRKVTYRP